LEKENMKRKFFIVSLLAVLLVSTFVLPLAMASPDQGQKVPIKITWEGATTTSYNVWTTPGGVVHREATLSFSNIKIYIDDSATPLTATAVETRYATWNQDLTHRACHRSYVITIPAQGTTSAGGFEGNSNLQIFDYITTPTTTYIAMAKGLFHGFGAFEGQTINAGDDWGINEKIPTWEGYLLKP
jgi:hypothetical protein